MKPLPPADYVFRIETIDGPVIFTIVDAPFDGFGELRIDFERTNGKALQRVIAYFDAHGIGMDGKPVSLLDMGASPIDIDRALGLNFAYLKTHDMHDPDILGYTIDGPMPPDGWTFPISDTAEPEDDSLPLMESASPPPGSATDAQDQAQAAMKFVLKTKRNATEGVWRDDIGWIAFLWGNAGKSPLFADGDGIANIVAQQEFERKYLPEEPSGEELCYRLVDILARGSIYRRYGTSSRPKIDITRKNEITTIQWDAGRGMWMLSGYRKHWVSPV